MKKLESLHLIQFSFFEAETFKMRGNMAILGPNGVGKTSVLDAFQIAMLGAHGNFLAFNSQSVSSQQKRNIKEYCLGSMQSSDEFSNSMPRKRDHAQSFITLVFRDQKTGVPISVGVCVHASIDEPAHKVRGLYIVSGVELELEAHLQQTEGGQVPLDWKVFEVELYRRAKAAGRTPFITTHPESYVDQLIHELQPNARHIDRHSFVRAFKKSMELKDIENVNDFVRDYLVDAQSINKQNALAQINRFRQLKNLIADTEEQINRLNVIDKDMNQLHDAYKRRDTIIAVRAILEREATENNLQSLSDSQDQARNRLLVIAPAITKVSETLVKLSVDRDALVAKISADPTSSNYDQAKQVLKLLNEKLQRAEKDIASFHLSLRSTLQQLEVCLSGEDPQVIKALEACYSKWEAHSRNNETVSEELLQSSLKQIRSLKPKFEELMEKAVESEKVAKEHFQAKSGLLAAQQRGAGLLSDAVGSAILEFEHHGIIATPVCSLLEVTDREWQGAIEAFLGSNREALVVEPGREREAVQIIRKHGGQWAYHVNIVQPNHLREQPEKPALDTVAALLIGDNKTALAFIRQILGSMKCVDTEEELERHGRSMTKDGMLSANGSTKRLRTIPIEHWQIGSKASEQSLQQLKSDITQCYTVWQDALSHLKKFNHAKNFVGAAIEASAYHDLLDSLNGCRIEVQNAPDPDAIREPDYLVKLRLRKVELEAKQVEMNDKYEDYLSKQSVDIAAVQSLQEDITNLNIKLNNIKEDCDSALAAEHYDQDIFSALYENVTKHEDKEPTRECEIQRTRYDKRISDVQPNAVSAFREYIDKYGVSLIEERGDWRKAHIWAKAQADKLQNSKLVEYKDDADEALRAAETSFRTDIAYRLREAIQKLEKGIRNLNTMLDRCPVFSSNERYRFEAKPAEAYKKIYNFIRHIDEMDGSSLFTQEDDARDEILQLLEASASSEGKKSQNPLEDYRLFYNFDLQILQDNKVTNTLSKRIGVASNGEHRVPFYVIAGAALAAAYRIDSEKPNDGAALMLLDEAFYGMDSQNSYAAAQFLQSIGLQLIMAGPESDQGKLMPMTDTMFTMARFGGDVFKTDEHFTEALQKIMTSDMPMLHPDLIDSLEAEIIAGTQ
ncbi:MAG: SbcC/MukB-like Walker B domain-containing protein [Methylotenera sp.]|jgi:hypothetical protein|nr:SbcC/MukB-like Walker B domain-containing protein [Methylotenera sp.]